MCDKQAHRERRMGTVFEALTVGERLVWATWRVLMLIGGDRTSTGMHLHGKIE